MVQYFQGRVQNISDLENRCDSQAVHWIVRSVVDPLTRSVSIRCVPLCCWRSCSLDVAGFGVGVRVLEILSHREKSGRREVRLLAMLQFIVSSCWKALFGKAADALERSTENENEYMIHELEPLTNKFVSVPPDLGQLDCAAYIAGIVRGILCSSGFVADVTAHTVEVPGGQRNKTVFLVKFEESVIQRERALT